MYTFKRYLKETKLPKKISTAEKKIFDQLFEIASNIEPFVKAIGGPKNLSKQVLWRGIKKKNIKLIKTIRKDRRPKDTEKNVSKVVDNWFLKNFKSRFRSNAIFASGSKEFSKVFGTPNIVIPKGNFSFVWSPDVSDLFKEPLFGLKQEDVIISQGLSKALISTDNTLSLEDLNLDEKIIKNRLKTKNIKNSAPVVEKIIKIVSKSIRTGLRTINYQTTGLIPAIKSLNEIMISGNEYYAIDSKNENKIFKNIKKILISDNLSSLIPKNIFELDQEIFILKLIELILLGKITR